MFRASAVAVAAAVVADLAVQDEAITVEEVDLRHEEASTGVVIGVEHEAAVLILTEDDWVRFLKSSSPGP